MANDKIQKIIVEGRCEVKTASLSEDTRIGSLVAWDSSMTTVSKVVNSGARRVQPMFVLEGMWGKVGEIASKSLTGEVGVAQRGSRVLAIASGLVPVGSPVTPGEDGKLKKANAGDYIMGWCVTLGQDSAHFVVECL